MNEFFSYRGGKVRMVCVCAFAYVSGDVGNQSQNNAVEAQEEWHGDAFEPPLCKDDRGGGGGGGQMQR